MSNENPDSAPSSNRGTGEWQVSHGWLTDPGRIPGQDSIEASQEENPRDDEGYDYTGYDSRAATRIGGEDDTDDQIERLRELNEGRHQSDGGHSAREAERDKKRVAEAICSSLPLSGREREHVVSAVTHLDLDRFGNQKSIPKVTLGVVAVIVDEQYREDADDLDQFVSFSDEFQSICDNHDISMSDMGTVKRIVREELETRPVPVTTNVRRRDPALPGPTPASEKPREYWDEFPAESWVSLARSWERFPEDYRDAIPDDYHETIVLLRKWEPWSNGDEADTAPSGESAQDSTGDAQQGVEASTPDGDLDDTAVAEALLEELDDAVDEE